MLKYNLIDKNAMTKMIRQIRPVSKFDKLVLSISLLVLMGANAFSQPNWAVNPGSFSNNMTLTGAVNLDQEESRDADDILAAFIDGECSHETGEIAEGDNAEIIILSFDFCSLSPKWI